MTSLLILTVGTGTAGKFSDVTPGLARSFLNAKRTAADPRFRHETETIINS